MTPSECFGAPADTFGTGTAGGDARGNVTTTGNEIAKLHVPYAAVVISETSEKIRMIRNCYF